MSSVAQSHECDILSAARELFARDGYDAVSTSAIAERAGVSKANVYHHFRSKEDLYFAVLRSACDEAAARWADVLRQDSPLAQRVREYAHQHLTEMCNEPMQARLVMREIMEHDEHGKNRGCKLAQEVFCGGFDEVVGMFRNGQEQGEIRADIDPAFAAHLLLAANASFFQWRHVMRHMPGVDFADDLEGYARRLTDILMRGLASEGAREEDGGASKGRMAGGGEPGKHCRAGRR